MAEWFDDAAAVLCEPIGAALKRLPAETKRSISEIRLHADSPILLTTADEPLYVHADSRTSIFPGPDVLRTHAKQIEDCFLRACGYSVQAFEPQIREGFLTLPGGHRLGLCGQMDVSADGMRRMTAVTSLNLRIARPAFAAAKVLCDTLFSKSLCSIIVAGPPLCGKTTMLRDLARRLSEGKCGRLYRVSVIDSRGEFPFLSACDVLRGCGKADGMRMALRALSPQMLLCDEIGTSAEIDALEQAFSAGAHCAVSVHGDRASLRRRKPLQRLLETGQFSHVVLLSGEMPCMIDTIFTARELSA